MTCADIVKMGVIAKNQALDREVQGLNRRVVKLENDLALSRLNEKHCQENNDRLQKRVNKADGYCSFFLPSFLLLFFNCLKSSLNSELGKLRGQVRQLQEDNIQKMI